MAPKSRLPMGFQGPPRATLPTTLPMLEEQFAQAANNLNERLLDLNVATQSIAQEWGPLLASRERLLSMYGVMVPNTHQIVGGMPAAGGFLGGAVPEAPLADWKSKLHTLASKRAGRPLVKGELAYNVSSTPQGFMASVQSTLLHGEYWGEAAATSKKLAEHAAAKAAMEAEFPESAVAGAQPHAAFVQQLGSGDAAPAGGKIRKAPGDWETTGEDSAKSRLVHAAQMLLGRPADKADVVYEVVTVEGGGLGGGCAYAATVSLPTYDPNSFYESGPAENKKQAEKLAAEAALQALWSVIAPLEEERKAKKARQGKEKMTRFREREQQLKAETAPQWGGPPS